jgi:hypothetical protein
MFHRYKFKEVRIQAGGVPVSEPPLEKGLKGEVS